MCTTTGVGEPKIDHKTWSMDDQFLLGSNLLIKPVTKASATSMEVYLPQGLWYEVTRTATSTSSSHGGYQLYDHSSGGATVSVSAPLHSIPVFQRGGSILFRKERVRRSSELMSHDPFTIVVTLDREGTATSDLYIDDGKTFNYKQVPILLLYFFSFCHRQIVL
jgi:alpha 1,3-glucosidase